MSEVSINHGPSIYRRPERTYFKNSRENESLAIFQPKGWGSSATSRLERPPQGNGEEGSSTIKAKSPQLKTLWGGRMFKK